MDTDSLSIVSLEEKIDPHIPKQFCQEYPT